MQEVRRRRIRALLFLHGYIFVVREITILLKAEEETLLNRENSTLGARKKADVQIDTGRTNIKLQIPTAASSAGKKVKNSLESSDIPQLTIFAEIICMYIGTNLR